MQEFVTPDEKGYIPIPDEIREKLKISSSTSLAVYLDEDRIIVKPVSRLDILFKDLREEAIQKGYTREELEEDLKEARQRVIKEYLHDEDNA